MKIVVLLIAVVLAKVRTVGYYAEKSVALSGTVVGTNIADITITTRSDWTKKTVQTFPHTGSTKSFTNFESDEEEIKHN